MLLINVNNKNKSLNNQNKSVNNQNKSVNNQNSYCKNNGKNNNILINKCLFPFKVKK